MTIRKTNDMGLDILKEKNQATITMIGALTPTLITIW